MMKSKLMFPLAALLMLPVMTGCKQGKYQASFNTDQFICTHGEQVINVTLEKHVKGKMHFKDTLTNKMFELPKDEKYKNKKIASAFSYNNGSSAYLLVTGNIQGQSEDSIKLDITVTKDAFKEDSFGGTISVMLYHNQIRYGDYVNSWVDGQGYHLDATIEMIGATPTCVSRESLGSTEYFEVSDNDGEIDTGYIDLYKLDGYKYFISVVAAKGGTKNPGDLNVTFKKTSLGENLTCTIKTGEKGPFYFVY